MSEAEMDEFLAKGMFVFLFFITTLIFIGCML